MDLFIALLPAVACLLVLSLLEQRLGGGSGDWWMNLQAWAVSIASMLTVYTVVHPWSGWSLIDGEALPLWAAIVLFILVQDLGENVFHRMQHKIPFLWRMHSLHHSDPDMSVLTTYRHFWGDRFFKTFTVWSAAALIISPVREAVIVYFFISLWNIVAHANLNWNFGKWSWVLNSPAYHRRHHSTQPEHYDSNFAALFPLWDVLLGGYNVPDGRPETGLDRQPRSLGDLLFWPFIGADKTVTSTDEVSQLRSNPVQ